MNEKKDVLKLLKIGHGSYGIVYSGAKINVKDAGLITYAVKRNLKDKRVDFINSIRELDILVHMKEHPCIVQIKSVSFGNPFQKPMSPVEHSQIIDDGIHFFFEKADCDLHSYLYEDRPSISKLTYVMKQILIGLSSLHNNFIIHRDLKPSNILIFHKNSNKPIAKICDFGLSKYYDSKEAQTPKTVTYWYRSPEICLGDNHYSYPCDIWSTGCIFYELITGIPLISDSTDNDITILRLILETIPIPISQEEFKTMQSRGMSIIFSLEDRNSIPRSFHELLQQQNVSKSTFDAEKLSYQEFIQILESCLQIVPSKRDTVDQLLLKPFFSKIDVKINEFPISRKEPIIKIPINMDEERSLLIPYLKSLYKKRSMIIWYKPRVMTMTWQLWNRYLIYVEKNNSTINYDYLREEEKEEKKILLKLQLCVCMYLSIKFSMIICPFSFQDILGVIGDEDVLKEWKKSKTKYYLFAEDFEKKMVQTILEYYIYETTIFEYCKTIEKDEDWLRMIILLSLMKTINGSSIKQFLDSYHSILSNK